MAKSGMSSVLLVWERRWPDILGPRGTQNCKTKEKLKPPVCTLVANKLTCSVTFLADGVAARVYTPQKRGFC